MARSNTSPPPACTPRPKPKLEPIAPYVEALDANGKWMRVVDDMGFPAGGPRTMTADLTGKLPLGTQKIRITTNLQVYWDSILIEPHSAKH